MVRMSESEKLEAIANAATAAGMAQTNEHNPGQERHAGEAAGVYAGARGICLPIVCASGEATYQLRALR